MNVHVLLADGGGSVRGAVVRNLHHLHLANEGLTMTLPNYTDMATDWSLIPERMRGAIRCYIERGIPPGHFLTAVLCNDLREAVARADDENKKLLSNYVLFLYNCAPLRCWGSPALFEAWITRGGLAGADE